VPAGVNDVFTCASTKRARQHTFIFHDYDGGLHVTSFQLVSANSRLQIQRSNQSPALAIIPARYDSTRFPGKVLANRTGKPLIQHVYEQARRARMIQRIIVATDDERIAQAVKSFGGEAMLTRRDHLNGTSRIAEAAEQLDAPIIVNVQGDEPEIEPGLIDLTIQTLIDHEDCPMATLASPFASGEDPANPNIVKVVCDRGWRAMYFSRAAIPFRREAAGGFMEGLLKHIGLYVYRREFLRTYVSLPPTPLEQIEKLEQLRVLEHGYKIAVATGDAHFHGIDTPEQYEAFVQRMGQSRLRRR
jgi:3-deoxy-manno-octulosonate cytidylyltransferase (CMP-KDO synthetase)